MRRLDSGQRATARCLRRIQCHAQRSDVPGHNLPVAEQGLEGLGRIRAVLRLGECADARPARRGVLAAGGQRRQRAGAGAWLRHRPDFAAAGPRRRSRLSASTDRRRCSDARRAGRALLRKRKGAPRTPALGLTRGDIRALPFLPGSFGMVLAPYGILQSLLRDKDLDATLDAVSRVLRAGRRVRRRPRARRAAVAGISEPRADARPCGRRRPSHPGRVGAAGPSPPPHDVRAGVPRAARHGP